MRNIAYPLEKVVVPVSKASGIAAAFVILAMIGITVADVVLRNFFSTPIRGTNEYIQMMMACVGFLGVAWCGLEDGHAHVDIIAERLPRKGRLVLDFISFSALFITCLILAVQNFKQVSSVARLHISFDTTGIQHFPFLIIISYGYLLLALVAIVLLLRQISGVPVFGKEDENER